MPVPAQDSDHLLAAVAQGDPSARSRLLERHRPRLRQMVNVHLDRRLSSRLDPSDLVQESLIEADRRLDKYLQDRPLPFYPWLRQIAWNRMVDAHRFHLRSGRRSVVREEPIGLPPGSAQALAERLFGDEPPSKGLRQGEQRDHVKKALAQLAEVDREVLVLRFLEQLTAAEVGAILGINEGAVRTRVLRALKRIRVFLSKWEDRS